MKVKVYLLILVFYPVVAFSQKDTSNYRWNICASAGIGFPQGELAYPRYANRGNTGLVSATEKLKKSIFDIVYLVVYNSNSFDLNGYLNDPNRGMGNSGGQAISNGLYQEINALAGLSIPIPRNSHGILLNIRFLAGFTYAIYPFMEYNSYNPFPTIEDHVYINSSGAFSFPAFDIGANLTIPVYKGIFITLNVDYVNAYAYWKTTEQITSVSGTITQSFKDGTSLNTINITGGIGYRFGK